VAEPERLQRLRAELRGDPQLLAEAERLLAKPAPYEPDTAVIKTDAASVDQAIARVLAMTIEGVVARIEL
jgi:hypothetical protein